MLKDLYIDSYKPLLKEIKETPKKWKDILCSGIGRLYIAKMTILLKAIYRVNATSINIPTGAPADWEDLSVWQEEAALRRRLAVQSIVLSLTEDGRYQRVQLYVADNDDDIPRRIAMAWLDPSATDPSLVLAASPRDEKVMLTPGRALDMILDAWQKRDFAALYPLTAPGKTNTQKLSMRL